ncbi:MAG: hypothetical protein AAGI50_19980, partial [Pseudomonadota bacterium]
DLNVDTVRIDSGGVMSQSSGNLVADAIRIDAGGTMTQSSGTVLAQVISTSAGTNYTLSDGDLQVESLELATSGALIQTGGQARVSHSISGGDFYWLRGGQLSIGHGAAYTGNIAFSTLGPNGVLAIEGHDPGSGVSELRDLSSLYLQNTHNAIITADAGGESPSGGGCPPPTGRRAPRR